MSSRFYGFIDLTSDSEDTTYEYDLQPETTKKEIYEITDGEYDTMAEKGYIYDDKALIINNEEEYTIKFFKSNEDRKRYFDQFYNRSLLNLNEEQLNKLLL